MNCRTEQKLLRIYIGEADKYKGKPLYEAILNFARDKRMAGATVLRGLMGFGKHNKMHSAHILRISENLPLVIEIVDTAEKIDEFLPELSNIVTAGLVTIENIEVISYRAD
jgi:PII-like signaling protein